MLLPIHKKKYYLFYTKNFNQYLLKILKKKNTVLKKKSFTYVLKTIKNKKNQINHYIETSFLIFHTQNTVKASIKAPNVYFKHASMINFTPLIFCIKKDLLLWKLNKKRQFYFFIKEITSSFFFTVKFLLKENLNILYKDNDWYTLNSQAISFFYSKYLAAIFSNATTTFDFTYANNSQGFLFNFYLNTFIDKLYFNNFKHKKGEIKNFTVYSSIYMFLLKHNWKTSSFNPQLNTQTKRFSAIKRLHKAYALFFHSNLIRSRALNKAISCFEPSLTSTNKFIWKGMNNNLFNKKTYLTSFINKKYFILPQNSTQNFNKKFFVKKARTTNTNFSQILYVIMRLEEKIASVSKKEATSPQLKVLIAIYNYLLKQIEEKQQKISFNNLILSNPNELYHFKKTLWQKLLTVEFKNWFNKHAENSLSLPKILTFYLKLRSNLNPQESLMQKPMLQPKALFSTPFKPQTKYLANEQLNFFEDLTQKKAIKQAHLIKPYQFFVNKKLSFNNNSLNYLHIKKLLKIITNKNIQIFYINALSLTKYAFNYERLLEKKENRSPTLFLQNIDRDLINKYKYIGIYIKDLIRICFIGMFLKKPQFIAKFLAFQIAKLPRNRKETSFIRFIIKVVKTFAAEREEILGLRIKFKGRVNRWRRTKSIVGSRGVLPLHTIDNFIECGSAQAINRKGALGIRIWIWYKTEFSVLLNNSVMKYFNYSKHLEKKKKLFKNIYFTKKN